MSWADPPTFVVGQVLTATLMNQLRDDFKAVARVGKLEYVIGPSGGNAVETVWDGGWLECNGAQVSRTTYASLYAYLNGLSVPLPFGVGNGTTTFHLPDAQGRSLVALASASGHADVKTIGGTDGVAVASRRPKHKHTVANPAVNISDPQHAHSLGGSYDLINHNPSTGSAGNTSGDRNTPNVSGTSAASTGITATATGGTVGPQTGAEPTDSGGYLVGGVLLVKF